MAPERDGTVDLVRAKHIVKIDGTALRREAASFERVVIDLGAGDGRFAYRLARAHPTWLCLAIDANANRLRECSYRAGRKPSRGGLPNVRFVRASVERLPAALDGLADEITVLYPWGSLLKGMFLPQPDLLRGVARLGKPGALLRVRINESALRDRADGETYDRLHAAYAAAGIRALATPPHDTEVLTSWGQRLRHGRPTHDIALDAIIS